MVNRVARAGPQITFESEISLLQEEDIRLDWSERLRPLGAEHHRTGADSSPNVNGRKATEFLSSLCKVVFLEEQSGVVASNKM